MKEKKNIEAYLRKKGEELPVPESVCPKQIQKILQNQKKRAGKRKFWYSMGAAAAVFSLVAGVLFQYGQPSVQLGKRQKEAGENQVLAEASGEERETLGFPEQTYEEIYACLSESWQEQAELSRGEVTEEMADGGAKELASAEQKLSASMKAFGQTNRQTEQVDEADRIKNDGRYLYQIAQKRVEDENGQERMQTGIQILDTEGGLKETAFVADFKSLEEFYLWEDLLITIENNNADMSYGCGIRKETAEDSAFMDQSYHRISIYQLSDKSHPRKQKTFTLQGNYESSRISDGYFYGISRFTAGPGEGEQDYDAYIPSVDGRRIEAQKLYCPPDARGSSFLVLVSIDLSDPSSFTDSRAIRYGSGTCYVSPENIYIAWYQSIYEQEPTQEGTIQDKTRLLRFSYDKGQFSAMAKGEIPGRMESSFSMDEYEGNLRAAVTVQTCQAKTVVDDRTGQSLGFDYGEPVESNSLYVLDRSLQTKGKVEGLAEGETIRSARFLGETGYVVTFRQTDPLFAVDLSDPEHPEVLGELKVSGFSEYLHIYGADRLLGIGMEADEDTGQTQGMKLSMFDTASSTELKEIAKFSLEKYNYSEALHEHRAVLIDTQENILGFEAEGSDRGTYWKDYLLFTYEEETFIQTLKIDARRDEEDYCRTRGTFIGDTFYLLYDDGAVRAYDRNTGDLQEELPR